MVDDYPRAAPGKPGGLSDGGRRTLVGRRQNGRVQAQVIVLAGPSGAGKSRLAERLGLPVLRLDDFYKDGSDGTLPRIAEGPNAGLVDWDHPDSWLPADAVAALVELCHTGRAEVPVYDLAKDGRCGWQKLDLDGAPLFVAEGIFAQDVVASCADRGLLAAAYCVRQHPLVTFWRRLTRDLREHRKPPLVLLRRGVALLRDQRRVVDDAVGKGCLPATPDEAYRRVTDLVRAR
jgi:uridine kinase